MREALACHCDDELRSRAATIVGCVLHIDRGLVGGDDDGDGEVDDDGDDDGDGVVSLREEFRATKCALRARGLTAANKSEVLLNRVLALAPARATDVHWKLSHLLAARAAINDDDLQVRPAVAPSRPIWFQQSAPAERAVSCRCSARTGGASRTVARVVKLFCGRGERAARTRRARSVVTPSRPAPQEHIERHKKHGAIRAAAVRAREASGDGGGEGGSASEAAKAAFAEARVISNLKKEVARDRLGALDEVCW